MELVSAIRMLNFSQKNFTNWILRFVLAMDRSASPPMPRAPTVRVSDVSLRLLFLHRFFSLQFNLF